MKHMQSQIICSVDGLPDAEFLVGIDGPYRQVTEDDGSVTRFKSLTLRVRLARTASLATQQVAEYVSAEDIKVIADMLHDAAAIALAVDETEPQRNMKAWTGGDDYQMGELTRLMRELVRSMKIHRGQE